MTFIKNNFLKIFGLVAFGIGIAFILECQRRRNVSFIQSFYEQDVNSIIRNIDRGSGGFYAIETIDGKSYNFCPHSSFFESEAKPGDSILKPALSDTIRIYNGRRELKFTFIKP